VEGEEADAAVHTVFCWLTCLYMIATGFGSG
jgi:hypothetical protein